MSKAWAKAVVGKQDVCRILDKLKIHFGEKAGLEEIVYRYKPPLIFS